MATAKVNIPSMLPVTDNGLSEQSQSGQGVWVCNAAMIYIYA